MASDVDYQDILDDADVDIDSGLLDEFPRTKPSNGGRDYRRAIEELREERRLRKLLADYALDDDL